MSVALITGASQGIGEAIAIRLAMDGFDVAINDVNKEKIDTLGEKVAEKCRTYGVKAVCFAADVSKYAECEKLTNDVKSEFGSIDVLVNNAGITRDMLMVKMSEENYDLVISVNQKSVFNMMKLAGTIMMRQKSGRIINMASVAGIYGNKGQINYSASKAAIIGMTKTVAKELGSRNVTVNAIAPGFIKTAMTDLLTEEQRKSMLEMVDLKRYGTVEDIAGAVSFLAGKDSSYITGQVIEISGGLAF